MALMKHCPKCKRNWAVAGTQKCPYCNCGLAEGSARIQTIADDIADYKATPQSAKDLLQRVCSKLVDLRCPHCGEAINVTIDT